jgi:hypothetical protein
LINKASKAKKSSHPSFLLDRLVATKRKTAANMAKGVQMMMITKQAPCCELLNISNAIF